MKSRQFFFGNEVSRALHTQHFAMHFVAITTLMAFIVGCASGPHAFTQERFHFQEVHMGAKVSLTMYADNEPAAATAARAAYNEIAAWDLALSDYLPDSEICALSTKAQHATAVRPRLAKALQMSIEFNHSSNGVFDCALGQLTKVWRAAFREQRMPSDASVQWAFDHSGLSHVTWDEATHSVAFDGQEIQLDFGAIGQGLAADAAMQVLRSHHISCALIDISGDILASDAPPQSNGWVVRVEPEFASEQVREVKLSNQALCVSGDRGQPGRIDGKILSHILNPKNGYPIGWPRQSVVIAQDATTADAIATIACIMSVDELKAFEQKYPRVHISIERLPEQDDAH